ncbi:hypothetical protein HPB50_004073 [Hyalomma asiaticum]|uniref:Uncharacterized protein n=1 Tax=Hyalomma asiaticum TaxID=266040 RepID=A0ACB7T3T0_HYAAI|nr:hypothetical protein HPB50_004073 [Hyalomma asiaticum]
MWATFLVENRSDSLVLKQYQVVDAPPLNFLTTSLQTPRHPRRTVRAFTCEGVSAGIGINPINALDVYWKPRDDHRPISPACDHSEGAVPPAAKSNLQRRPGRPIVNPSKPNKAPLQPE